MRSDTLPNGEILGALSEAIGTGEPLAIVAGVIGLVVIALAVVLVPRTGPLVSVDVDTDHTHHDAPDTPTTPDED